MTTPLTRQEAALFINLGLADGAGDIFTIEHPELQESMNAVLAGVGLTLDKFAAAGALIDATNKQHITDLKTCEGAVSFDLKIIREIARGISNGQSQQEGRTP